MLKILGVGLPRTGTASLCEALRILGFNAIHHAPERLDIHALNGDWRKYDDVDAVTDAPACAFYSELAEAYPEMKAVLTVRDPSAWFESMAWHIHTIHQSGNRLHIAESDRLHRWLFGDAYPTRGLYLARYRHHNESVKNHPLRKRLLVMDITQGWATLCPFLGVSIPKEEFPWLNKRNK